MIIKQLQMKSSNSTTHRTGDQTKHVWLCAVFVLRVEGEMGGGGVYLWSGRGVEGADQQLRTESPTPCLVSQHL